MKHTSAAYAFIVHTPRGFGGRIHAGGRKCPRKCGHEKLLTGGAQAVAIPPRVLGPLTEKSDQGTAREEIFDSAVWRAESVLGSGGDRVMFVTLRWLVGRWVQEVVAEFVQPPQVIFERRLTGRAARKYRGVDGVDGLYRALFG